MKHTTQHHAIRTLSMSVAVLLAGVICLLAIIALPVRAVKSPTPPVLHNEIQGNSEEITRPTSGSREAMPPAPLHGGDYRGWKQTIDAGAALPDKRTLRPAYESTIE